MRLLIDPGHGGKDPGCMANGLVEKTVNLALARLLYRSAKLQGCTVGATRTEDVTVPLAQRALPGPWDLTLCLHCDTSPKPSAGFLSTYVVPESALSVRIAAEIERAAPAVVRPPSGAPTFTYADDWTKRAHHVLQIHPNPAVLIECGFLSNPIHAAFLATDHGRMGVVSAIMLGVSHAWGALG